MGPARGFSERALRAIERRQMLCIGVISALALTIGAARSLEPDGTMAARQPISRRPSVFAARVSMIDKEPLSQQFKEENPLTSLPSEPSRIPQIVQSTEFRSRLMLADKDQSISIDASTEPQTRIVHLTVRAASASEAVRIANLAARELIVRSREESRTRWAAWQRTKEAEVAAASRGEPIEPPSSGDLGEVLERIRNGRAPYWGQSCRQVLEEARLLP